MATYHFQVCTAALTATFDCPSCGKTNRKRTLRADCTVNPFNKNEDGTVKTHAEVRKQSQEKALQEREHFMRQTALRHLRKPPVLYRASCTLRTEAVRGGSGLMPLLDLTTTFLARHPRITCAALCTLLVSPKIWSLM